MARSVRLALLAAVVAAIWTGADAVEVFLKTSTKLYDSEGKVIQEVSAGYPFEADRAQGKWVYGFLKAKGGGRRGFIAIEALDMADDDRRALNIPITTGKSAEPVLLRYTLKAGERQVYEMDVVSNGSHGEGKGRLTQHLSTKTRAQLGFSFLGTGKTKGIFTADARYHKLRVAIEVTRGTGRKVRIEGTERGVTLLVDGERVSSGKWEDLKSDEDLNFGTLLTTTARVKISDRLEYLDMGGFEGTWNQAGMMGGIAGMANVVYPDRAVRGGDSWQAPFADVLKDKETHTDTEISGTVRYTVLERTEFMKRPCVKLLMEMDCGDADASPGVTVRLTARGTQYVDEERGIPMQADITASFDLARTQGEKVSRVTSHLTVTTRYAGTEVK
ncbi:MAG: hypothetical protein JW889_04685 [Verrucomicrobia bacterium]|nr:hypothetical protein [Verrucomicrobiota bacterium]